MKDDVQPEQQSDEPVDEDLVNDGAFVVDEDLDEDIWSKYVI